MHKTYIPGKKWCHYCKAVLTDANRTRDHKFPKSKGGRGADNYVWACRECNAKKADLPYETYISRTQPRLLGIKKADGTFLEPKINYELN